ncbi:hypothetical protein Gste01_01335 [Geobacillus stearothermophilus ATCC 7953]
MLWILNRMDLIQPPVLQADEIFIMSFVSSWPFAQFDCKQQGRSHRPVVLSQPNFRHTLHMRRVRKHVHWLDFDRFVAAVF